MVGEDEEDKTFDCEHEGQLEAREAGDEADGDEQEALGPIVVRNDLFGRETTRGQSCQRQQHGAEEEREFPERAGMNKKLCEHHEAEKRGIVEGKEGGARFTDKFFVS